MREFAVAFAAALLYLVKIDYSDTTHKSITSTAKAPRMYLAIKMGIGSTSALPLPSPNSNRPLSRSPGSVHTAPVTMAPPRSAAGNSDALSSLLSGGVVRDVWRAYSTSIPPALQVVDALLVYVLWSGAVLFAYALAVGSFPFNAFVAAFLSCVGVFVLTVALRMQINPVNVSNPANRWEAITPQRAYADWLFCNFVLHMAVLNFVG